MTLARIIAQRPPSAAEGGAVAVNVGLGRDGAVWDLARGEPAAGRAEATMPG
jgi:hypothetical protein